MKFIAIILASLMTVSAKADIIKCQFTEPFVDIQYSMTQSKLTITDNSNYPHITTKVLKNISFQIAGPADFQLWDLKKNVVAKLTLNHSGSNGMSDDIFPYEVEWNGMTGGCTSNLQAVVVPPAN